MVKNGLTKKDALVAIVPRKKDWGILERKHWYRVPVKSAPKITEKVKFLAFYQPKIFGDEKWAVNYYAEVKRWEIVKRIELLPDEPKHSRANEDYYKFTIGELKKLSKPIPSKRRRRIVFIRTTLNKLMKATEINDLYHTSHIEEKLYESLKQKKIPSERQFFVRETKEPYCLDFAIFCKSGKLDIECDGDVYHSSKKAHNRDRKRNNELTAAGWAVLRFSGSEIHKIRKPVQNRLKRQ